MRFNTKYTGLKVEVTPTATEIRERAVWIIEVGLTQGSAFFLKDVGLVTAAHCVEESGELEVYNPGKPANKFQVSVLKFDKHRDLAILKHTIPPNEYFELERSQNPVVVGTGLTAIGYPGFGPGDKLNVREGKVSSLPVKHAVNLIEVTQKLSQGMSGGPLLDSDDAVVGIVHKGGSNEERDFATHISVLNGWLSE